MKRLVSIALLALVPMLFSACGGGGDSDEDQIREAVDQIATAKGTEEQENVCDNTFTPAFLQEVYGGERQRCIDKPFNEDEEIDNPGEITVASVIIKSPNASVKIETVGGDTDGVDGTWTMIKDGGDWKLDHLENDYVRAEFAKAIEIVDEGMVAYEPMRKCFISKADELDPKSLRAIAFAEGTGEKKAAFDAANKLAESCPRALNGYVAQTLADQVLSQKKVSDKVTECSKHKMVGLLAVTGLAADALKQNNRFGDSTSVAIAALIASAVRECKGLPAL